MNKSVRNLSVLGVILLLFLLTWLGWCRQSGGNYIVASLIPKDVAVVTVLDIPKMVGKLNFELLKQAPKYQTGLSQMAVSNPVFAEIMRDPLKAGIDFYKAGFITMHKNPESPDEGFSTVLMALNDPSIFEKVIHKSTLQEVKKSKGFQFVQLDRLTAVGWNNQYAIFGNSFLIVNMENYLSQYFNLPTSQSILKEPSFQQALQQNGEMLYWVSLGTLGKDSRLQNAYGLRNIPPETIENNFVIGGLNFGKGVLQGQAEFLFKSEVAAAFNNFFTETYETDFSKYVSEANRSSTFFAGVNIPGIYNYMIRSADIKKMIEKFLQENGFDVNQLMRILSGDFVFINYYRPQLKRSLPFIGTQVYRPELLQEYLDKLAKNGVLKEISTGFYLTKFMNNPPQSDSTNVRDTSLQRPFHLLLKEDKLFFTSDVAALEDIYYGGYGASQQLQENIPSMMKDKMITGSVKFEQLYPDPNSPYSGLDNFEFSLNKQQAKFELNFKDKSNFTLQKILVGNFNE